MIKAVFFDVDGTLVSLRDHCIPDSTLRALHRLRRQGVQLFVSSGRHRTMMEPVTRQFEFDGYNLVNGQYCLYRGRPIHTNPIPRQGVEEVVQAMERERFSAFFLTGEEIFLCCEDEAAREFIRTFRIQRPPVCAPERALEEDVYQVIAMLPPEREGVLLDGAAHLKAVRWHHTFTDVMAPDGGKDVGIDAVLSHLGLRPEEAMAFGDGGNDIAMLRCVGVGVAMGNAEDRVKAQADYVTASVEENGVEQALKHFGLL